MSVGVAKDKGMMSPFELRSSAGGVSEVALFGDWTESNILSSVDLLKNQIQALGSKSIRFDSKSLTRWNSALVVFVSDLRRWAEQHSIEVDVEQLPQGVHRLIRLADASPTSSRSDQSRTQKSLLVKLNDQAWQAERALMDALDFLGRVVMVTTQCIKGCARFRPVDFVIHMQECGVRALPIISLISFLMGLILAYVGAVQLERFGATVFVADLVAIAIVREMGPIMAAIVMAGRTGAAFAAQLGTMKINQEIDAYKTMAISPYQFLVLPRLISLCLMMPLLCIFANTIGIIGGGVVANISLDMSWTQYWLQAQTAIGATDILLSVVKAFVFGIIVAFFGCYRGMNSGDNALAVGEAATSAVVSSLVFIILVDAIFAVTMGVLGI